MRSARLLAGALCLGMTACASNSVPEIRASTNTRQEIAELSCPAGVKSIPPEKIAISSASVGWGEDAQDKASEGVRLIDVLHITSLDSRIGGLSGMDFIVPETALLVADDGALVWMDIDGTEVSPVARASYLKDERGQILSGKIEADSEGLAFDGDLLFVSLERDHRILAYNIKDCGTAARGIELLGFPGGAFGIGSIVKENSGMESIASVGENLLVGIETRGADGRSPIAEFSVGDTDVSFDDGLTAPEITQVVGMDYVPSDGGDTGRLYSLFRSYDPFRGNRIGVYATPYGPDGVSGTSKRLIMFGNDITVDNFEGISVLPISDRTDRIHLISDNNFSDRQRTLLAVMEYDF